MSNDEILLDILNKLNDILTYIETINNAFLWFIGAIVAIFVCYLLYKVLDEFISF